MEHRIYRSRRERIVAGVATGWGVLLYAVLWVLLPAAPRLGDGAEMGTSVELSYRRLDAHQRSLLLGGTLIGLGLIFLAKELGLWWWLDLHRLWPLLLIAAGVALLLDRARSAP